MPNFRKRELPHVTPNWVPDGETYFITINCERRWSEDLIQTQAFECIRAAAQFYESKKYWLIHDWVVMPDHIHALLAINTTHKSISQLIGSWKRYVAKATGISWQKGFFEHRIRDDKELAMKANYLLENPVRAGLVSEFRDWPYFVRMKSE